MCKKWKSVTVLNSSMNKNIQGMRNYIDTVGNEDIFLKKSINVDSLKKELQAQLDLAIEEQKVSQENAIMDFKKNGMVYSYTIQGVDSAKYIVNEENEIEIDDRELKGYGELIRMKIIKISADTLQLRMVDYGDTTFVTMIPALD